jgi:predicted MPP superfamily phosphohydrolase
VIGYDAGNLVFALSAVVDTLLLSAAVVWAVRSEPVPARLLAALAAAAALMAVKGIVLLELGVSVPFGVMHVLWLDLVVAIPLAAVLLLALTWRRAGRLVRAAALMAVLLAPVGAYASLVEPERLTLERAELELDPGRAGERPLQIGVIADLQCEEVGDHEREAVDRLMEERPDVILLAGDYHQGAGHELGEELPALRSLMSRLDAPGGVFAVQGDVESIAETRQVMAGTGVRVLVNEVERVSVGDRRVSIAGIELAYWSRDAGRALARLERRAGAGDIRIALAHRPDAVRRLSPDTRVDLTVAGHTHGGQVQLPLVGPLTISSRVPRRVGAGGLHELDGRWIYVSRGVGAERAQAPRLRLGAVPEVSLITLR